MVHLYLLNKVETQCSGEAVPASLMIALGYSSLVPASNAKLMIRSEVLSPSEFLFGAVKSRAFYCLNKKDSLKYKL